MTISSLNHTQSEASRELSEDFQALIFIASLLPIVSEEGRLPLIAKAEQIMFRQQSSFHAMGNQQEVILGPSHFEKKPFSTFHPSVETKGMRNLYARPFREIHQIIQISKNSAEVGRALNVYSNSLKSFFGKMQIRDSRDRLINYKECLSIEPEVLKSILSKAGFDYNKPIGKLPRVTTFDRSLEQLHSDLGHSTSVRDAALRFGISPSRLKRHLQRTFHLTYDEITTSKTVRELKHKLETSQASSPKGLDLLCQEAFSVEEIEGTEPPSKRFKGATKSLTHCQLDSQSALGMSTFYAAF